MTSDSYGPITYNKLLQWVGTTVIIDIPWERTISNLLLIASGLCNGWVLLWPQTPSVGRSAWTLPNRNYKIHLGEQLKLTVLTEFIWKM